MRCSREIISGSNLPVSLAGTFSSISIGLTSDS
jgi:hypothetical protein